MMDDVRHTDDDGEIDTWSDEFIICPWCGEEHDPTDLDGEGVNVMNCDECGKRFVIERSYSVEYDTTKREVKTTQPPAEE